jgi:hypothetical protein
MFANFPPQHREMTTEDCFKQPIYPWCAYCNQDGDESGALVQCSEADCCAMYHEDCATSFGGKFSQKYVHDTQKTQNTQNTKHTKHKTHKTQNTKHKTQNTQNTQTQKTQKTQNTPTTMPPQPKNGMSTVQIQRQRVNM